MSKNHYDQLVGVMMHLSFLSLLLCMSVVPSFLPSYLFMCNWKPGYVCLCRCTCVLACASWYVVFSFHQPIYVSIWPVLGFRPALGRDLDADQETREITPSTNGVSRGLSIMRKVRTPRNLLCIYFIFINGP